MSRPTIIFTRLSARQIRALERADIGAVAQHRDAVRQLIDFGHAVADVDDREPFLRATGGSARTGGRFRATRAAWSARPSRGCGQRACTARAISTSCCSAIDRSPTSVCGLNAAPRRFSTSSQPRSIAGRSIMAHRAAQLAPGVDVLGHDQVGREAQFLVDHRDAERRGRERAVDHDGLALDQDLARRDRPDRRRTGSSSASTCRRRSRPSANALRPG